MAFGVIKLGVPHLQQGMSRGLRRGVAAKKNVHPHLGHAVSTVTRTGA